MPAAIANLGGENENGALDTTVSVEDEGSANEKAGLVTPNENAVELVVTATELEGVVVTPKTGVAAVVVGVAAATPNLMEVGVDVVAGVVVAKLKAGAVVAGVAVAAGTPNFMPLNAVAAVDVDENENPVAGTVVTGVVVLNAVVVVEATDDTEGIPNFIWEKGVGAAAIASVPGLGVSQAAHLVTSDELLT